MRVVECERAREYSSARGLACNAREYYTITTRVTCESLASVSRASRECLASDTRVPFNLLVDGTVHVGPQVELRGFTVHVCLSLVPWLPPPYFSSLRVQGEAWERGYVCLQVQYTHLLISAIP